MKIRDIQSLAGKTIMDVTLGASESVHINFTDGTSIEVADTLRWVGEPPRTHARDSKTVHRKRIQCADGHSISVQASWGHYCEPRDNRFHNIWLYDAVEVGYPETRDGEVYHPAELEAYREQGDSSVYPYTPIGVVAAFVHAHGGAVSGGEIDPNL